MEEGDGRERRDIMKRNVGGMDRAFRLILCIAAAIAGLFAPVAGWLRVIAFAVAFIALFTAIFGF